MPYGSAKIYSDGGHYIGIPKELQSNRKPKKSSNQSRKLKEEIVTKSNSRSEVMTTAVNINGLFETLYKENLDKKPSERHEEIVKGLKPYIEKDVEDFVKKNLERKLRNQITRKIRLYRKVNLNTWSYFCTFTYDNAKHTEESFRVKLSNTLKHLANRKSWKYIGVWERSPTNNRLHFHALVYTPQMIGNFEEKKDYSTKNKQMQTTYQNTHFLERFGRNDFKVIDEHELSQAVHYLTKYMEKSGERIVYSRNIPTYFVSDIMDEDVVCTIGNENKKLLLFDDFNCWNEGVLVGKVSKETIKEMPKVN